MKISDNIISIPPYISTSWDHVISLSMEGSSLLFSMEDGKKALVPGLSAQEIEQIFSAHAAFLEAHPIAKEELILPEKNLFTNTPFRFQFGTMEQLGQVMEHNPAQSGLPPIPEESLDRIRALSKIISEEEIMAMPAPETNCNCMYCQVARTLRKAVLQEQDKLPDFLQEEAGEKVAEEELTFEEWIIEPFADKMYRVTNKLDSHEQYTVHLSDPIGCTCGKMNCEHIVAVLRS
jgi:hypothetical protein